VVSNRIADARIQYAGIGVLAESQRPGWITRVLTWLGL
jgi:flagellar basal body L-ring protein FlgH